MTERTTLKFTIIAQRMDSGSRIQRTIRACSEAEALRQVSSFLNEHNYYVADIRPA